MTEADRDRALEAVTAANQATGRRWRLRERLPGGLQSGAWLLDDEGAAAVLKVADTTDWARQVVRASDAVAAVRRAGYPTPAWLAAGATAAGTGYQVQSWIGGRSPDRLDVATTSALIEVLERQTCLDPDPGRCWSSFLEQELGAGLPSLRAGARSAGAGADRLVEVCDRVLAAVGPTAVPVRDMVHGDFRRGNVLMDDGRVVGMIDIEAIGSGTRVFDYATLLDDPAIDDDALSLLVSAGAEVAGPTVLLTCFVRVALDLARFLSSGAVRLDEGERSRRVRELTERTLVVSRLAAPGGRI